MITVAQEVGLLMTAGCPLCLSGNLSVIPAVTFFLGSVLSLQQQNPKKHYLIISCPVIQLPSLLPLPGFELQIFAASRAAFTMINRKHVGDIAQQP